MDGKVTSSLMGLGPRLGQVVVLCFSPSTSISNGYGYTGKYCTNKIQRRLPIPKIKFMPYFQATQWDDPFTWCCGLVSLLTIGSTCTPSTACKKKNSHKIRVITWNTWHTYWASYQREIKESSMKGGGGGGEGGGEEEIGFRKQGFFL